MTLFFRCLIVIAIILSCSNDIYSKYEPIYFDGVSFKKEAAPLNRFQIESIAKVFTFYKVNFKIEQNKVFYKGTISEELLWNYTNKAKDSLWLNTH